VFLVSCAARLVVSSMSNAWMIAIVVFILGFPVKEWLWHAVPGSSGC
jgi:hypothetical protein